MYFFSNETTTKKKTNTIIFIQSISNFERTEGKIKLILNSNFNYYNNKTYYFITLFVFDGKCIDDQIIAIKINFTDKKMIFFDRKRIIFHDTAKIVKEMNFLRTYEENMKALFEIKSLGDGRVKFRLISKKINLEGCLDSKIEVGSFFI